MRRRNPTEGRANVLPDLQILPESNVPANLRKAHFVKRANGIDVSDAPVACVRRDPEPSELSIQRMDITNTAANGPRRTQYVPDRRRREMFTTIGTSARRRVPARRHSPASTLVVSDVSLTRELLPLQSRYRRVISP